jgi:hypothetical protein
MSNAKNAARYIVEFITTIHKPRFGRAWLATTTENDDEVLFHRIKEKDQCVVFKICEDEKGNLLLGLKDPHRVVHDLGLEYAAYDERLLQVLYYGNMIVKEAFDQWKKLCEHLDSEVEE